MSSYAFDFRAQGSPSNGVYSAVPGYLTCSRSTAGCTVRTGLATVKGGLAANTCRAYNDGTRLGMLAEPLRTNAHRQSLQGASGWSNVGTGSAKANAAGPDGVSTSAVQVTWAASGSVNGAWTGGNSEVPASSAALLTVWLQAVSGGATIDVCDGDNLKWTFQQAMTAAWVPYSLSIPSETTGADPFYGYRSTSAVAAGTANIWGPMLELGASYGTSVIATTTGSASRVADSVGVLGSLALPRGFLPRTRVVFAPLYSSSQQTADHNLIWINASNRVYLRQSDSKVVATFNGQTAVSAALSFAAFAAQTVEASYSTRLGLRLWVNGTQYLPATQPALVALSVPAKVFLLGGSSGSEEGALLQSVVGFHS